MFKNLKLKGKLLLSFFIITCIATASTTIFSIYHFYGEIRSEALKNMHKNMQISELLYNEKLSELQQSAASTAADGPFQILVQALISYKLEKHLEEILIRDAGLDQILVTDQEFQVIGQATRSGRLPEITTGIPLRNALVRQTAALGRPVATTEELSVGGKAMLLMSAASPIHRSTQIMPRDQEDAVAGNTVTGYVLLRYVLNDNPRLLNKIRELLNVNVAIFLHGEAISHSLTEGSSATRPRIPRELYQQLIARGGTANESEMRYGRQLASYQALHDHTSGKPVAVLGVSVAADQYMETITQAIWNLSGIMLLCIAGAYLLGYLLARSILIPIQKLLDGVKRVTSGDLSHEIVIDIKDELGILAISFNSMARQLHELFSTLEQRIENATRKLQNTLAHLAAIIDNMADGLLVTDTHHRIIRFNPALSRMFPSRELLGHGCGDLHPMLEKLAEQARHVMGEVHSAEINLGEERVGQAVATAIMHKDTFAEEEPNHYAGSQYIGAVVLIRDITREKELDRMMESTINTLTHIGRALSAETNMKKLLEMIVVEACNASNADGGTLYTVKDDHLHYEIVQNKSMDIFMGGTSENAITMPPLPLNESKISAYCAIHKQIIHAPNVYANQDFDFTGTKQYDKATGYRTNTMLVVPLLDRMQAAVGVLQLINPMDPKTGEHIQFDKNQTELIYALASQAAVALENARNYEKIERKNAAFERFVPTQFLRHLGKEEAEDIELGDASQEYMSVLFSDIRSFTNMSETMTPEDNFHFLNDYLRAIGPSIVGNGGFIDKYIGDAIMALFPGHGVNACDDAVAAAVGMFNQLRHFNHQRQGLGQPLIHIGIGLHTGHLMLGTIGFEDRMESTVIGDTVNLASRVEGLTKHYGVDICITEDTFHGLSSPLHFGLREIDTVRVKGKEKPVTLYEVVDGGDPRMVEQKLNSLARYHEALELYKTRRWSEALRLFTELQEGLDFEDSIVGLYARRCRQLYEKPPLDGNWNQVTVFAEK